VVPPGVCPGTIAARVSSLRQAGQPDYTIAAELGDINRFPTPRKLAGFSGLCPVSTSPRARPPRPARQAKESHAPVAEFMQKATALLPDRLGAALAERAGIDRLSALASGIDAVRRGGTLSIVGVYGGQADPMPMMDLFDKGIQIRMGQAHVKRWIPELLPLVLDDNDPLATEDLAPHVLPLADAPQAYEMFQQKQDGAIKILLIP
jgi:threonine dehydrogenase-like Zn-dependent dehydrogenase